MDEVYYLGWFDDNPKKSAEDKIDEAIARYAQKYGHRPNVCLVSPDVSVPRRDGVVVRPAQHVHANSFLTGWEGAAVREPSTEERPVMAESPEPHAIEEGITVADTC